MRNATEALTRQYSVVGVLILLLFSPAVFAADEAPLPLELFEFIAEWQDDEGHWVDPLALVVSEEELEAGDKEEERRND